MAHRPDIYSFNAADRQTLVDLILPRLTDEFVSHHLNIIHSGVDLFTGHDAYIADVEAFLTADGGGQFVLLPTWNPNDAIPDEFNVVRDQDGGAARPALVNLDPNRPKPAELEFPAVCEFENADELGNAVNPWHGGVHVAVGGAFGSLSIASAAPIFFCWHAFVNEIYWDWLRCTSPCPNITNIPLGLARLRLRTAGLRVGGITRLPRTFIRPELLPTFGRIDPSERMFPLGRLQPFLRTRAFRRVLDFDGETLLQPPRRFESLLAGPRVISQIPVAGTPIRLGGQVDFVVLDD